MDRHTAKVLYIDFGNEEDVKFDQIHALSTFDAAPPCVGFSVCYLSFYSLSNGHLTALVIVNKPYVL